MYNPVVHKQFKTNSIETISCNHLVADYNEVKLKSNKKDVSKPTMGLKTYLTFSLINNS